MEPDKRSAYRSVAQESGGVNNQTRLGLWSAILKFREDSFDIPQTVFLYCTTSGSSAEL